MSTWNAYGVFLYPALTIDRSKPLAKKTSSSPSQKDRSADEEVAAYRALQLDELRARANLSMDRLAKAMGFAGQSSIQRYLSSDYQLGLRPEMLDRFKKALLGKGDPPIVEADFALIANNQRLMEIRDRLLSPGVQEVIAADRAGKMRAVLPLPEGPVILEAPSSLSSKSIDFLKAWLDIVGSAIESQVKDANRSKGK